METGNRDYCTHVVKNGNVLIALTSPLSSGDREFGDHLRMHGDGVKDVAFSVDDTRGIYKKAVERGAVSVSEPKEVRDADGVVIIASVKTYGDTIHTFV